MKKNVLMKTNVFICAVITVGFLITAFINYHSSNSMIKRDTEYISTLTADTIYHQIDSIFTKPINISLTMANDSLLKSALEDEKRQGENGEFIETMKEYLYAYKEKYDYDSVFLVSTQTNRYYHFKDGVDRILTEGEPENTWYFDFLQDTAEYSLNIDNDEAQSANNEINIFVNCKIFSPAGEVIGVVGVGFGVDALQELFRNYEESYQLRAYLVDSDGTIELSTMDTGIVKNNLFEKSAFGEYAQQILTNRRVPQFFWYSGKDQKGFLAARFVPNLSWHLIIDNDTSVVESRLNRLLYLSVFMIFLVGGAVLLVITGIIRKYNRQIVGMTVEQEKTRRTVFQAETEKLYENIYEIDVTHNQPASEATESYFESLGASGKMPYDKALYEIARQQIKEEHREGYIRTFSPENVLKAYEEGTESLRYEFMITNDAGLSYYWMRITARIFYWEDDKSVRMLIYRQNIDKEKRHELRMAERMQQDSLTGLYNKAATQKLAHSLLKENSEQSYGFFILDIDDFKTVNDTLGHAFGDLVIVDFAQKLRSQFGEQDIVGRIGGDEFVVFAPVSSRDWAEEKAKILSQKLTYEFSDQEKICFVSASIGIAVSPEAGTTFEMLYQNADAALYEKKKNGKKGYTIC